MTTLPKFPFKISYLLNPNGSVDIIKNANNEKVYNLMATICRCAAFLSRFPFPFYSCSPQAKHTKLALMFVYQTNCTANDKSVIDDKAQRLRIEFKCSLHSKINTATLSVYSYYVLKKGRNKTTSHNFSFSMNNNKYNFLNEIVLSTIR